jgi:Outer membrane protein beta-barrel domain
MNLFKLAILALALVALPAQAQTTRGGKSEFYIAPVFTDGKNYTFEGGSNARTDTGWGLTFGYAFNFDQKKSLGIEFVWADQDYRANVVGDNGQTVNINGSLETWTVRFLGTYNFMEGNFTPFVTGGLGWTYLDTNIPTGLPQNVCWYYPWYAYCTAYVPTATTNKFSYNAGAGLRFELGKGFIRAMVNQQWMDFGGSYGSDYVTQWRIDFGTKF